MSTPLIEEIEKKHLELCEEEGCCFSTLAIEEALSADRTRLIEKVEGLKVSEEDKLIYLKKLGISKHNRRLGTLRANNFNKGVDAVLSLLREDNIK